MTLLALIFLVGLGNWQMRRLAWKEALIANMNAARTSPPKPLAKIVESARERIIGRKKASVRRDGLPDEFTRVTLTGRFEHDQEFHVWSPGSDGPGWTVITPLRLVQPLNAGSRYPMSHVLVIRGRVSAARKAPSKRRDGQVPGVVQLTGRLRYGNGGGYFAAKANPVENKWYDRDLTAMRKIVVARLVAGSASGSADEAINAVAPFYVEAETVTGGAGAPGPKLENVRISNKHLGYALTWYGLALALLGVFIIYAKNRLGTVKSGP